MNKKISLGSAIAFMAIVAAITLSITWLFAMLRFNTMMFDLQRREAQYSKISEIDRIIEQNYLNTIDENVLMDAIAQGYIQGLDDTNALYMDSAAYSIYLQELEGKFVGIGVESIMDPSGYIQITEVYPDSPAEVAGLQKDDLIVKMDDVDVTADNYGEMVAAFKGEAGTKVTIVYRRDAEDTTMEITRRQVEVPTVYSQVIGNVGYIKITSFAATTNDQFSRQYSQLVNAGVKGFLIDLRGTSGDNMRAAAQILDTLLPEGTLISTLDKNGETQVLYSSESGETDLPITLMTNDKTTNVAELFAQCIKDYGKGKTVGTATAGSGYMQSVYKLSDGSAIKITTAVYLSPSGLSFTGEGVSPDYEVKTSSDFVPDMDSMDETTDAQFKKAMEVLNAAIKGIDPTVDNSSSSSSSTTLSEDSQASDSDDEDSDSESSSGSDE